MFVFGDGTGDNVRRSGKIRLSQLRTTCHGAQGNSRAGAQLKLLMDKAERAPAGSFVNVIAYQTDHTSAREELKVIDAAARNKKCAAP